LNIYLTAIAPVGKELWGTPNLVDILQFKKGSKEVVVAILIFCIEGD